MSPIVARTHGLRRLVATLALALIAATGINTATASTASAAPADYGSATDGWATFTWGAPVLAYDVNGNGIPDVGDRVDLPFTLTGLEQYMVWYGQYAIFTRVWITGSPYNVDITVPIPVSGAPVNGTASATVQASMLDALGGGPFLPGATFVYTAQDGTWGLNLPAPPALYAAPTPITVTTGFAMTEVYGFEADKLVEGDQVSEVTRVTNSSAATLTITGPDSSTPAGAVSLAGGATQDFVTTPVGVTYADMVAGGVTFAEASVNWGVDSLGGTVTVPAATAPTEAIDTTVDASATFTVHSAVDGSKVPMGAAAAGDMIDVKFNVVNEGNVTLNYIGFALNPWVAGVTTGSHDASLLTPGASLPNGVIKPKDINSAKGAFTRYTLTSSDIALGYVDVGADIVAAPSSDVYGGAPANDASRADFGAAPASYTTRVDERVFLKDFTTKANLKFTDAVLNDTNGDGIGQEGETVFYRVRLANNANQNLIIDTAGDASGSDVATPVDGKFIGSTVVSGDAIAKHWTYTITAADVLRGRINAGVAVGYHGDVDGASNSRASWADTIPTGDYVAPTSTLDTAATYDDTNLDGFPSIGETAHVTVTVANVGGYPLTGLAVADAAGSDVTGLLPVFPASIAAGASAVETFDYVLTAADFARGSLTYITEMTATGLPTTASSTSVHLTGITFQAYATDLDTMEAGGIQVCESDGTPTDTITLLSTILVHPGATCTYAGLPYGYRIVGFSTPLLMTTDTFSTKVPAALQVGAHRLALYAPDGTLVGWKAVTAKDPIALAGPDNGGALASTGANGDEAVNLGGGAVLLMLLGTAFVVADSRRRKHAGR